MSEMTIVECDYGDGECLERFEGFRSNVDESSRFHVLTEAGWTVDDDRHYCPKHSKEVDDE